ncbi:phenylacetic acid degradation protein PaaN [Pseudochrobactrum kiredjianiae]|uniref:Phenylacetic acid degradation protein PaaN n=1 Tax=Pseudochrobactrum kiredjianiae TaxID=386305 RepID=A0ABW3V5W9_9HYPH|nr:phenylacetic acid degradation protein PaaN [Pseudochrobactrum kiredjianiae]MDM7850777.1 phenylacetic acid degradation protein PaaN [Pseudochrobactrum kiredjianiae]
MFWDRHFPVLESALAALHKREFWTPYPEIPSGKIYGETAKQDGLNAYESLLNKPFILADHPENTRFGAETSPYGTALGITYPAATVEQLMDAANAAADEFAQTDTKARIGALLEVLARLNRESFLMGNAVMHTTGQAFAMAFQAGGPHAQDRALEAVAMAWEEMNRFADHATWEKPQGKNPPLRIEKHWSLVPEGIALAIGCNTFPTWNSFPGIFASLATGNPTIVKPHPSAVLPLAIAIKVIREVFAETGLPVDAILLAIDSAEAPIADKLAVHSDIRLIDYTGSSAFGGWLRDHARQAQLFTEEAGVNTVTIAATDNFKAMTDNLAFSFALYSGQMCTSPQNVYIPADGIETDEGHKSFEQVAQGLSDAIDRLLNDPDRAAGICGAIANPATLERVQTARKLGRIIRDSASLPVARSATPLILAMQENDKVTEDEWFGPIIFVIPAKDATSAIQTASALARRKGAITAALYDTDETRIQQAAIAFARGGVNLSVNLTGNIFVNQSAAFSDFHVTGANPAGNACLTDTAFVASRFRRAMWRRPATN